MMIDRSLHLVVWRVRVASDYWLILTKLSILDALCGAEIRMYADDQGTSASRAVRNILRCGFIRGLLRHGYSAENGQAVFWLSPYLCTHSDPLADDLKRQLMFRLCGCRSSAKREDRVSAISPYLSSERRTRRQ